MFMLSRKVMAFRFDPALVRLITLSVTWVLDQLFALLLAGSALWGQTALTGGVEGGIFWFRKPHGLCPGCWRGQLSPVVAHHCDQLRHPN